MGYSSVDYKHFIYTLTDCLYTTLDLRNHTARNYAFTHKQGCFTDANRGNEGRFIVLIAKKSDYIGHKDKRFSAEGRSDTSRRGIGVDIINIALIIATNGGNYGDITLLKKVGYGFDIDICNLSDKTELGVLHFSFDKVSVGTCKTDCLTARVLKMVNEGLVDLSCKHHLNYFDRFFIGDSKSVDEL